jgi:energy-coupling factor transport system ATP-binding protein
MTRPEPAVLIRDLSFRYPRTVSGRSVTALRNISLTIGRGECVVITGPSGSGKSSLVRCFNGLIPHATKGVMGGDVFIHGMNTREHDVPDFAPHVGLVFQDPDYQIITGDVTNEIAFGLETLGHPAGEIEREISACADLAGIRHLLGRPVTGLSWGERQRVAIASVLAMHPSVLVMDEPFSGIDVSAGQVLLEVLRNIRKEQKTTVIILEHRITLLKEAADRLVVLDNGAVSFDGRFSDWKYPRQETRLSGTGREGPGENRHKDGLMQGRPDSRPRPAEAALSFRQVRFRYPGSAQATLDDITLDFFPGEITVITGQNGSGKTTLLKLCNGLLHPNTGEVLVQGVPVGNRTVATLSKTVGLLCQHADFQLFESTIADELVFAPRNLGMSPDAIARHTESVVRECVLDHIGLQTPPLGLSGGEKQRVAIAGLFMMDTPVVVLDEPTFGLDYHLKHTLAAALRTMTAQKKTVIVATHDEEFAALCADRYIGIAQGHVIHDVRVNRDIHTGASVTESGRDAGSNGGVRG